MPDTSKPLDTTSEASLFTLFTNWLNGPDTVLHRKMPAAMGALETGLWAAYCAGYQQAASDRQAAQRLNGALMGTLEQGFNDCAQQAGDGDKTL